MSLTQTAVTDQATNSVASDLGTPVTESVAASPTRDKTTQSPFQPSDLSELVDQYASADSLPAAVWITELNLVKPRRDIHCMSTSTRFTKRTLDLLGATFLLLVMCPFMLLTAVFVLLTSRGPVIFRQTRVGLNLRTKKNPDRRQESAELPTEQERRTGRDRRLDANYGKPFELFKFRTMRVDAEKNGAQFTQKKDPRVTPIGRFLRKTRLDELPQLWNVLKGEMSLVGPRPERPEFIQDLSREIPNYVDRLGLKPGLTGPAQVINGYDNNLDSFRRKVAWDLLYLQNCCLWNDIKILFRTIGVVLTGKGAL
jgi:lipopolysaccharide/colanic/teichoic acid biosynthesis glycosyltransferase